MDSSSLSNRERRRKAAASRRAARDDASNNDGDSSLFRDVDHHAAPYRTPERRRQQQQQLQQNHSQRQPLEGNLLSSLSQALTNIDKHNNDYFAKPGVGDGSRGNDRDRGHDGETITFSSPHANHSSLQVAERKSKHHSKLPPPPSHFSSYLRFNRPSLRCLLAFATCYAVVLICCSPMISTSALGDDLPTDDDAVQGARHHIKRGASFARIRGRKQYLRAKRAVSDRLGTLKERAIRWEEEAKAKARRGARDFQEAEREVVDSLADATVGRKDGADARRASALLDRAIAAFDEGRVAAEEEEAARGRDARAAGGERDHWRDAAEAWDRELDHDGGGAAVAGSAAGKGKLPGFVVLGMHRSGTSMLSGLLVKGFGYETGGPLIGASFDNEKGFYERIDVVLQNDEFMGAQNSGWSWNAMDFDPDLALLHKRQGKVTFKEGEKSLRFLNNRQKTLPYLQKDPRMCIVLPTWLKLLDEKPAVVFTYRHPLEVALSLKHREQRFTIEHGLRLWIVYNMKALQNSEGLCRVYSTNEAVFKDPMTEVQRIKNELTDKCHVMPPPTFWLPENVVEEFVDPKLQHNSKERKAEEASRAVLKDFGNDCVAREFESDFEEGSSNRRAEVELYLMAMGVFCDLENGKAYAKDYQWPDLVHWHRPARIN